MASLDPTVNWLELGAQTLKNPRPRSGEYDMAMLYRILEGLQQEGKRSLYFCRYKIKCSIIESLPMRTKLSLIGLLVDMV